MAKQLQNQSINTLACAIVDHVKKYNHTDKLNTKERFIVGLAYSEFYSDTNDENDLYFAECKRQGFLKALGINGQELVKEVESIMRM